MTTRPVTSAPQGILDISAPMACIGLTACERAFVLNVSALKQMLMHAAQGYEDATRQGTSPGGTSAGLARPPLQQPMVFGSWPQIEPMLSYGAELFGIYQAAAVELGDLLTAQSHGNQKEVDTISKRVQSQANEASKSATEAVGTMLNTGMDAVSRMTSTATQAGQRMGARASAAAETVGHTRGH